MKYLLVDRFLELSPGEHARAVKCVTYGEPYLNDLPHFPPPLVLEGMLQTGGVLTRAVVRFSRRSVVGTVSRAEFPGLARPGDRIEYDVRVALRREEGTLCEGVARVGGREIARAEFMIVFVPPERAPPRDPAEEQRTNNLLRAWQVPAHLIPGPDETAAATENVGPAATMEE